MPRRDPQIDAHLEWMLLVKVIDPGDDVDRVGGGAGRLEVSAMTAKFSRRTTNCPVTRFAVRLLSVNAAAVESAAASFALGPAGGAVDSTG